MKKTRFNEEQIIAVLREQEGGIKTAGVCRKQGIGSATFNAWKAKYGGMDVSQARKLKVLEEESCLGKSATLAAQLSRLDLVVLDELGYLPFARSGGQLLFHLMSKLYERTLVLITTNLAFGEWPTVFGERRLLDAD